MGMFDTPKRVSERFNGLLESYLTPPSAHSQAIAWEYAILQFHTTVQALNEMRDQINKMGSYGWELCQQHDGGIGYVRSSGGDYCTLFFKRPA